MSKKKNKKNEEFGDLSETGPISIFIGEQEFSFCCGDCMMAHLPILLLDNNIEHLCIHKHGPEESQKGTKVNIHVKK